ncbi:uncharacterized protein [Choristoneura fumiferana]|uniref:uncharacterized protein n=1 Tax=Choristoneura fumiferana TaxID=7141 RepID=UPI003D155820
MYRMVRVADEDADFQRIVWREDPAKEVQDYKLLTVTFGTAAAPYLAVKALNQVAKDHKMEFPLAADKVEREFYMDDLMSGAQTLEQGIKLYKEMSALLKKGGFLLQKWSSNNQDLITEIYRNEKQPDPNNNEDKNLEIKEDNIVKILGLTWNKSHDELQYSVKLPPLSKPITKRKIISDVARLFDPLGWIAPCVITAKVFIQRLWITGVGWDEEPSTDIIGDWLKYREELLQLTNFRLPRWLKTRMDDSLVELHGFCDASNVAYAAVVYLRIVSTSGDIHVNLIGAKTKVAPVKQVSIPRLELCGAALLAKLLAEIAEVMDIPKTQTRAWTDSTVVLAWLNKHPTRRGHCLELYSDNGTNFVGASKELRELFNLEKSTIAQEIAESLATQEPQIGDIVLIKDDDLPPAKWLFGRIDRNIQDQTTLLELQLLNAKVH